MMQKSVRELYRWLRRVIRQPNEELSRWQQAVRFAYDLGRTGARQLRHDRAPQMAAALAFRALFGLIPVLIVGTVFVRSIIGVEEFLAMLDELLVWVGMDQVRILNPAGSEVTSITLADWLEQLVAEAAGIQITAIGWLGMAVLCYAAISLLVTVENVFNIIFRASDGRPWSRRVPLYWFLLTVGPLIVGVGTVMNNRFEAWLTAIDAWPWAMFTARLLWVGVCGWVLMLALYLLLPNAHVRFRPAAIGALVAVVILEFGKRMLGTYVENAFSISQLYGSLGLIPLFMFWTYLMCLAVLFGLQVSAILQMLHGRRLEEIEESRQSIGLVEPDLVVSVMQEIAQRHQQGKSSTPDKLAEVLSVPRNTIQTILDGLFEHRYLHRLEGAEAVSLARPAEQINADQLMEVGFALLDASGRRRSAFSDALRDCQREFASTQTLASLSTS